MAKIRIHTWAKEHKMSSLNVVKELNAKGHKVRNQMASVDEEVLQNMFSEKKSAPAPKVQKEKIVEEKPVAKQPAPKVVEEKATEPKREEVKTVDKKIETNEPKAQAPVKSEENQTPRQGQSQGGYQGRNQGQSQGGYQGRNQGQGGYQGRNQGQGQGGYQGRNQGQGQGGYQGRNQGQGQSQGGYQGRNQGQGQSQGGYQGRNQGQGQGGYQGRNQGQGQGGYQGRNQGQGQGGYQGRNQGQGQGGYQGRPQGQGQGGYQGRPQGQGGYQGRNQGQGGYQGRPQGQGQGGYQGRSQGQGQGGYQGRNQGQGGYQGRSQGQGQGGYQGGAAGSRPPYRGNQRFDKKPEATTETDATKEGKTNIKAKRLDKKKVAYDKFKYFDKKENGSRRLDNGKTRTQLKKEARFKRQEEVKQQTTTVVWSEDMTIAKFATDMNVPATDIIGKLFELGVLATMNQILDRETAELICTDYNVEIVEDESNSEIEFEALLPKFGEEDLVSRPPIVTIMGHVDHGKTTLLDTLRKANVTAKEAGGITQHIGAYQIERDGFKITFLDTPGHEAFTAMRARGANVTDITILVVAADDGVMPQTKEAIAHAKEAQTPLIVAVNKMDKEGANPERVMAELAELGIQSEEWGGDTPFVKISAKNGDNLDELLDYIKILSDINEFKAPHDVNGFGTVIEAHLDRGRGAVATILLQGGQLSAKDSIVIGDTWGAIRLMQDEYGKTHKTISASMPVEITGLKDVPNAGDQFVVVDDAKTAQLIGEKRASLKAIKDRSSTHALSLNELNAMIEQGDVTELPVIIKADVQGSVEALAASLLKIEVNGVKVRVVHRGVGAINESDVMLAQAGGAILIGFNVRPDAISRKLIEKEKLEILVNNVIYKIIEEIEDSMNGMRAIKKVEEIVGYAKVGEVFKISGVGKVAGAMCTEGKILRSGKLRLLREGVVIYDGEIGQLKRYKDDVKEVINGQECGISFKDFDDIKSGDELESYIINEEIV